MRYSWKLNIGQNRGWPVKLVSAAKVLSVVNINQVFCPELILLKFPTIETNEIWGQSVTHQLFGRAKRMLAEVSTDEGKADCISIMAFQDLEVPPVNNHWKFKRLIVWRHMKEKQGVADKIQGWGWLIRFSAKLEEKKLRKMAFNMGYYMTDWNMFMHSNPD